LNKKLFEKAKTTMKYIKTTMAPDVIGPDSQAVLSHDFVFVSTQIAPSAGDIKTQTQETLNNLEAILTASGCNKDDVVKTTILLTSMDDCEIVNTLYADFVEKHKPARATYDVSALPKGALIEIEAIAAAP